MANLSQFVPDESWHCRPGMPDMQCQKHNNHCNSDLILKSYVFAYLNQDSNLLMARQYTVYNTAYIHNIMTKCTTLCSVQQFCLVFHPIPSTEGQDYMLYFIG